MFVPLIGCPMVRPLVLPVVIVIVPLPLVVEIVGVAARKLIELLSATLFKAS